MTDIDFLRQEEVVSFILENAYADVNQLLLNPPKIFKDRIRIIADQILARQKSVGKLDSWFGSKKLIFPPPLSIEQASSQSTSKYKEGIFKGKRLVDLTGGTGIDCLSLSHNFSETIYVEQDKKLCEVFEHNSSELGHSIQILNKTAEDFLANFEGEATFFIDPARRDLSKKKVFKLEDCSPNLIELVPLLKYKADTVLVKLSPLLDLTKTLDEISNVKEVHIVSVKNDCKELLLLLDFDFNHEPTIHAINLESNHEPLIFKRNKEQNLKATYSEVAQYLYEPNASILKAGAFKTVAQKYGVQKISSNTHLYTSQNLITNFPGKTFEIKARDAKKQIKNHQSTINVLTRNYPLKAPELKKRFGLKDGGDDFLIGFRDQKNKSNLVIAKRLD